MDLTALDSIASGALGAVVVAIVWIVKHESQLKGLLNLLPSVAQDAAKARTAVETAGVGTAVTRVKAELDDEAKDLLRGLLAKREAEVSPMAEPAADSTPVGATDTELVPSGELSTAEAGTDTPAADPAPEAEPAPVASIAGIPDGNYWLRNGQLIPATV